MSNEEFIEFLQFHVPNMPAIEHAQKLVAESIPIISHHCTTTHSACECVLERLKKLEKVAEAAKIYLNTNEDDELWPHAFDGLELALAKLEGGEK